MSTTPDREELLLDLLADWEDRLERGEEVDLKILCRDHPELTDEVERRFRQIHGESRPKTSQMTLEGRVLGDYQLLELLGRGGMGEVYRGYHLGLNRSAAIKVIRSDRLRDASVGVRFEREVSMMGQLDHPNLVHVFDARKGPGWSLVAMELIDGLDASKLLKRVGRLSSADASEIARQTALGLSYLHSLDIVHRDIKPPNLMITRMGVVKILDLGVARSSSTGGLTGVDQYPGTLGYMSPERLSGDCQAIFLSDIYALGCTLYHLLTGNPPFVNIASPIDLIQAHRDTPVPRVDQRMSNLPTGLASLIQRMLDKEPAMRPHSAMEVADALYAFAGKANLTKLCAKALSHNSEQPSPTQRNSLVDDSKGDVVVNNVRVRRRKRYITRFWSSIVSMLIVAASLGLLASTWRSDTKPTLRIRKFEVFNFPVTGDESRHVGLIGEDLSRSLENDSVKVVVEFSSPAYAYLIAMDTNGDAHVVLPEQAGQAPIQTEKLSLYPFEAYGLEDGPGIQGFAVLASVEALPSFNEWNRRHQLNTFWARDMKSQGDVWRFDGHDIRPILSGDRAKDRERGAKVNLVPEAFVKFCRALVSVQDGLVVEARCFSVDRPLLK